MVASARVGRWGVLRIHSTPKPLYFSFLQTKMERSLPTDAVQRIKAKKSRVFILMLVNTLENWYSCTSAVKLSCRENDGANASRTLVSAPLTGVNCKEMPFKANQIRSQR